MILLYVINLVVLCLKCSPLCYLDIIVDVCVWVVFADTGISLVIHITELLILGYLLSGIRIATRLAEPNSKSSLSDGFLIFFFIMLCQLSTACCLTF